METTQAATRDQNDAKARITSASLNPGHEARLLSRHNLAPSTVGLAPGYLQVNLVILPSAYASNFRDLCTRNPVPCPLLGFTPVGDPTRVIPEGVIKTPDFDVRTDFPSYRVLRAGREVAVVRDVLSEWTDDHVAFLIGCSLSFEEALEMAGHRLSHQDDGKVPAMYKTNIPVLPAGVFHDEWATIVVSMRPYRPEEIDSVRSLTRPFLATHGEPIAWGWEGAKRIGVADIHQPDFGDVQNFRDGEVPVFWVCDLTSRRAFHSSTCYVCGCI